MKYSRRHSIKTFGKLSLGSMAFTPFMNHLAAQRTTGATPKRFLFVLKNYSSNYLFSVAGFMIHSRVAFPYLLILLCYLHH